MAADTSTQWLLKTVQNCIIYDNASNRHISNQGATLQLWFTLNLLSKSLLSQPKANQPIMEPKARSLTHFTFSQPIYTNCGNKFKLSNAKVRVPAKKFTFQDKAISLVVHSAPHKEIDLLWYVIEIESHLYIRSNPAYNHTKKAINESNKIYAGERKTKMRKNPPLHHSLHSYQSLSKAIDTHQVNCQEFFKLSKDDKI